MLSADFVTATGVAYVGLLFLIAYVSDRQARQRLADEPDAAELHRLLTQWQP